MDIKKQGTIKSVFLVVYVAISIATFYHTSWGFGTIAGAMPTDTIGLTLWWLIGGLSAFSIDVGMGAITYAVLSGWDAKWLIWSLIVLAVFSAFAQLVFSSHHAYGYAMGVVPQWLGWLKYVLDARTLVLPIALPTFSVVYAFAAKIDPNKLSGSVLAKLQSDHAELSKNVETLQSKNTRLKAEIASMNESMQSTNGTVRYVDIGRVLGEVTNIKAGEVTSMANNLGINPSWFMRGYNQSKRGEKND